MINDKSEGVLMLEELLDVLKEREADYGPCNEHFQRTVDILNVVLHDKLREKLTPDDWAKAIIADKLARLSGTQATLDGVRDIAGYAACWVTVAGEKLR